MKSLSPRQSLINAPKNPSLAATLSAPTGTATTNRTGSRVASTRPASEPAATFFLRYPAVQDLTAADRKAEAPEQFPLPPQHKKVWNPLPNAGRRVSDEVEGARVTAEPEQNNTGISAIPNSKSKSMVTKREGGHRQMREPVYMGRVVAEEPSPLKAQASTGRKNRMRQIRPDDDNDQSRTLHEVDSPARRGRSDATAASRRGRHVWR